MKKCFKVSDIRKLQFMLSKNEITYSRMVEMMNEMVEQYIVDREKINQLGNTVDPIPVEPKKEK